MQVEIIRAHSPGRPVAHNFMQLFTEFDHYEVARDLDLATWDSYPLGALEQQWFAPELKAKWLRTSHPDFASFNHDVYRGMSKLPFWVMEQQPGPVNWAPWNPAPLPGMVRLWSWEAFAHGAGCVSYFRWRQAPFAQEQMHAGLNTPDNRLDIGGHEAARVAGEIRAVAAAQADADAAVRAYAAVNGRFPCPATRRGGDQDCGAAPAPRQKGWFPRDVAARFAAPGQVDGMVGLRYMALRGSTAGRPDLAGGNDVFPSPDYGQVANGHDLCRELATLRPGLGGVDGGLPVDGRGVGADPALANVPTDRPGTGGAATINVAFGLASPGAAGFTGANADDLPHMESPAREQSATYTERVHIADTRSVARSQSCGAVINGLNVLAMADDWNLSVPPARNGAIRHFTELTVVPLSTSIAFWQTAVAVHLMTQMRNRSDIIAGISGAAAKDVGLCLAVPFPFNLVFCVAAALQGEQGVTAAVEAGIAAGEVAILELRTARAAVDLALAMARYQQYASMPIWTDSPAVLTAADRRGLHM